MSDAKAFKKAFNDFLKFTLDLLERIENENQFKFIVLNAHVTFELFIKAYFLELNLPEKVFKTKGGSLQKTTRDFSEILRDFIRHETVWAFDSKRTLNDLMEIRNAVVHRGGNPKFNQDMATEIVKIFFFINLTSVNEFGEAVFEQKYSPSKISSNETWRNGIREFIDDVMSAFPIQPMECPYCLQPTLIYSEEVKMVDGQDGSDLICLTCFGMIDNSMAKLACCYICKQDSYLYDSANPQENRQYVGRCINVKCRNKEWISTCNDCDSLFFESESQNPGLCPDCSREKIFSKNGSRLP